ncbi:MAG: glycoside hydrolase family 71/99-like protein [Sphingobacteriaceae bacterium]
MIKVNLLVLIFALLFDTVSAQSKHSKTSRFKSYKGLIMAGYQGWFNAPEDGAGRGWYHYKSGNDFKPGYTKVDMWPETAELEKTYQTPFLLANGKPAFLPSSHDASTIQTHFKWMKEYGVDGAFMQRFVTELKGNSGRNHFNTVLGNALRSSQKYGRAIAVMYDLSGIRDSVDVPVLINDWKNLVDSMKITSQGNEQTYLYHNGKPLVVLWGVGFNDQRKYGLKSIEKMMDFLKNDPVYGGCAVMLGVPTYWREFGNDTEKDPHLHEVILKADIVHPWAVGRFSNASTYNKYAAVQKGDMAWCKQNRIDYVPVVFPGFSWHNMSPKFPSDQIPRNRGKFFWMQLSTAIKAGAEMIYVAMFDEIDEATAIFKIDKNPPAGASTFVTFEPDIPADYYLNLIGYAGKMLRKQLPYRESIPLPTEFK